MTAYEDTWRQVKAANPKVAILASNYDWLMPQLVVGADGILSGLANLVPHMLMELWRAAKARDLDAMRRPATVSTLSFASSMRSRAWTCTRA